jgi:hypothetical protein
MADSDRQFEAWLRPFSPDGNQSTVQPNEGSGETPTQQAYGDPDAAVRFLVDRLFEGKLPSPVLAFNRQPNSHAYVRKDAFAGPDGKRAHELSLNVHRLQHADDRTVLATIACGLVEISMIEQGRAGRSRSYRSKSWREKMQEIGLRPVARNDGRTRGYGIAFEIVEGGAFDIDCAELLASGFKLRWRDALSDPPVIEEANASEYSAPKNTRTRFVCVTCSQRAWAAAGAVLACGKCNFATMTPR